MPEFSIIDGEGPKAGQSKERLQGMKWLND